MSNEDKGHNMPKSQQILLAIILVFAIINFILSVFILPLSSITLRTLKFVNMVLFGIFMFRQIKRKGF